MSDFVDENSPVVSEPETSSNVEAELDQKIKERADALHAKQVADIEAKAQAIAKNRLADMLSTGSAPSVVHHKGFHMQKAVKAYSPAYSNIADLFGTEKEDNTEGNQTKLYGVNFGKKKYGVDAEIAEEFKQLKKNTILVQLLCQKHAMQTGMPRAVQDTPFFKRYMQEQLKAYDLSTFANFIPTLIPRQYFEEMHLPYSIKDYFKVSPMQSQLERREGVTGKPYALLTTDTAALTAQSRAEDSFTLTAKDFTYLSEPSQDIIDDATPDIMDIINNEHGLAQLRALELAIINGDDTATHMDSDTAAGAANLPEKSWKGLRKKALANSANGGTVDAGGAFNAAVFQALFTQMSKGALNGNDLLYILGDANGKMLRTNKIPEFVSSVIVAGQGGFTGSALPMDGRLPQQIYGAQAYSSDVARETLNASGVYDGSTTTWTNILFVKLSRFVLGERMPMKMWMDRKNGYDIPQIASKTRYAFNGVNQTASEVSVINAYEVAKS